MAEANEARIRRGSRNPIPTPIGPGRGAEKPAPPATLLPGVTPLVAIMAGFILGEPPVERGLGKSRLRIPTGMPVYSP
jgi:hypothetical protein